MAEFVLALVLLGLIVCVEECIQPNRRKTEATWD